MIFFNLAMAVETIETQPEIAQPTKIIEGLDGLEISLPELRRLIAQWNREEVGRSKRLGRH